MEAQAHILLVEDDAYSRDMLTRRLAARGFVVTAVGDAEAGLQVAGRAAPDLVLLDVNLPGMSGLEAVRHLRATQSRELLPVILVTALGESADVIAGLEAGANDYVVKPVNLPVLLARLHVCLQVKRSVTALMEAERDRVMLESLGRACEQIAQPLTAAELLLQMLSRHPPADPAELRAELAEVLSVTREAGEIIHRLRAIGRNMAVSYATRVALMQDVPDPGKNGNGPSHLTSQQGPV